MANERCSRGFSSDVDYVNELNVDDGRSDRKALSTAQITYHISCSGIGMRYLLEIGA